MIRLVAGRDLPPERDTECAARIYGWREAYGEARLVQFFADEAGTALAFFDGAAVLDAPAAPSPEWVEFLRMLPGLRVLRTDGAAGQMLTSELSGTAAGGGLLRFAGAWPAAIPDEPAYRLPQLYPLLQTGFSALPPFDSWYVDVSHRLRHGVCHTAVCCADGQPVSMAMTVAESETAAVIGGVVTAPAFRRRGLASRCVTALLSRLSNKRTVWIAPANAAAEAVYLRLGFVPADVCWTEIYMT